MKKDPTRTDRLQRTESPVAASGRQGPPIAPDARTEGNSPPAGEPASRCGPDSDFGNFASIAYFSWDERGVILDVNLTGSKLMGSERSEVIGLPFHPFVASSTRPVFDDFLQTVFTGQRQVVREITLQKKDHALVYLRMEGALNPSGPGGKACCQAAAMDITGHVRTAEELGRSRDVSERLAEEMAAIAEIGRVMGSSLNIEEVYEGFAAETRKLIPFDSLIVNLKTAEPGVMEVTYTAGIVVPGRLAGDRFPLRGSLAEVVMEAREGMILPEMPIHELIARYPAVEPSMNAGLRAIMVVPLISKDEALGTLMIRSKQPGAYREQDLRLAERIGAQIAGAMANAQLYAALRRTESSLRESEEKYRELFEFLPICVFESDASGRLVSFNRAALEMFRYAAEDLRDITDGRQFYVREEWKRIERDMREVMHGASKSSVEYRYIRKDGSIFTGLIFASPIVRQGVRTGMRGAIIDISDRLKALQELQKTKEHLLQSEKLAAIGRLAAGVAHEILNPVNIISLELQLLGKRGELSPTAHQELTVCMEQIHRIVTIAEGLERFSRVKESRLAKADVTAAVDHVLTLCLPQMKMSGIQTIVRHSADLPMTLMDRPRIEQVIMNLITNAAAAMEGKEEKGLRITIGRETVPGERDCLRVTIADTGTGIREQDMTKLFEPFFTTKEPGKGTGLGLSLAFGIIQDHGGRIWAENNEWGGASFFFEIPITEDKTEAVVMQRR